MQHVQLCKVYVCLRIKRAEIYDKKYVSISYTKELF